MHTSYNSPNTIMLCWLELLGHITLWRCRALFMCYERQHLSIALLFLPINQSVLVLKTNPLGLLPGYLTMLQCRTWCVRCV